MTSSTSNRAIYNIPLDYRFLKQIRLLINKTTYELAIYMGIDQATLSKLENQTIKFTDYYEQKLKIAIKKLHLTNFELLAIYKSITLED
ncbi:helix-turn-helix domain-containing protein [Lysinibacillus capsici]|uniref:helix-turn-helix domain-containing protein n=1 Tax=Lysinibacillus capsici TaxID=2115968 RepID=UPI0034E514AD